MELNEMQSGITRAAPGYNNMDWKAFLSSALDLRLTGVSGLDVIGGGGMQGIGANDTEERVIRILTLAANAYIAAGRNKYWALHDSRGMTVYPECKGQIWVDRNTGRPLRLVFRAVNLPTDFDFRDAVITVDYNDVAISGAGTFLLPSRSTTKACLQHLRPADTKCRTNVLVFHDCRKFGTESHILSDKPHD